MQFLSFLFHSILLLFACFSSCGSTPFCCCVSSKNNSTNLSIPPPPPPPPPSHPHKIVSAQCSCTSRLSIFYFQSSLSQTLFLLFLFLFAFWQLLSVALTITFSCLSTQTPLPSQSPFHVCQLRPQIRIANPSLPCFLSTHSLSLSLANLLTSLYSNPDFQHKPHPILSNLSDIFPHLLISILLSTTSAACLLLLAAITALALEHPSTLICSCPTISLHSPFSYIFISIPLFSDIPNPYPPPLSISYLSDCSLSLLFADISLIWSCLLTPPPPPPQPFLPKLFVIVPHLLISILPSTASVAFLLLLAAVTVLALVHPQLGLLHQQSQLVQVRLDLTVVLHVACGYQQLDLAPSSSPIVSSLSSILSQSSLSAMHTALTSTAVAAHSGLPWSESSSPRRLWKPTAGHGNTIIIIILKAQLHMQRWPRRSLPNCHNNLQQQWVKTLYGYACRSMRCAGHSRE